MLGKFRLRPSFLLEVAFLIGVWLVAWRVFDPPLGILVFIIFAAYALVFFYENWLDRLSRRERADARRSSRKESEIYSGIKRPSRSPRPWPSSSVEKLDEAQPAAPAHSISERLTAKVQRREVEVSESRAVPEAATPVTPPKTVPSAPSSSFERPPEQVEQKQARRPEPQPEPPKREEPVLPALSGSAPRSPSEAVRAPRSEPLPVREEPHSMMAEIAAGPDARKASGPIGGWNVWQLERLLDAQAKPDPERDYERSAMLIYLREFADSDGQLPPEFDDLVRETFSDLVHGPAS
jgi:hypothetical protein